MIFHIQLGRNDTHRIDLLKMTLYIWYSPLSKAKEKFFLYPHSLIVIFGLDIPSHHEM